jgi:hypothetical protein
MKWKHGAIGTTPGVGPMWIPEPLEVSPERLEERQRSRIVVFDAFHEPSLYVWPAQRLDLVAYVQLALQWSYTEERGTWPVVVFNADPGWKPRSRATSAGCLWQRPRTRRTWQGCGRSEHRQIECVSYANSRHHLWPVSFRHNSPYRKYLRRPRRLPGTDIRA